MQSKAASCSCGRGWRRSVPGPHSGCNALQEEPLRAALLLEQAALSLLQMSPPSVRKFAFHLVLAGLRYNAVRQQKLGMRAYR